MILGVKLLLAPALVIGSSLAGRRWGDRASGALVALPIVAGPILAITTWEQGPEFGARAASSALLGLVTLAFFAVTVAAASRWWGWGGSLLAGWVVCLIADLGMSQVSPSPEVGLVAVVVVAVTGERFLARLGRGLFALGHGQVVAPPRWDLAARAVATGALVLSVTAAAAAVGPELSGVLAPFPIASSVVTGFALAQGGRAAALAVLRGLSQGLVGFGVFCYLVAVLGPGHGIGASFGAAAGAAVGVQALIASIVRAARSRQLSYARQPRSSEAVGGPTTTARR